MVKRVLMIVFHYPPMSGSSGVQRGLKFSRYLREHEWHPLVLTASARAYETTSHEMLVQIPPDVVVKRAFALDAARHLAVTGRYPGWLARPDRWLSWWAGAVTAAIGLIRRWRPAAIWSTYPIATAHLIALSVHRATGLPWIADFRDPMTDVDYPEDIWTRRVCQWIERRTLTHAAAATFTTAGALRLYQSRYRELARPYWVNLPNGFDEEDFCATPARSDARTYGNQRLELLHSGVLYPSERDPTHFFRALATLRARGLIDADRLHITLRKTGHDDFYRPLLEMMGLHDLVTLAPAMSHRAALTEMMNADGLLILQAANCNNQVPAKLYEYLRAGRPILGLTDILGDTAAVLRDCGVASIAPLDDAGAIGGVLTQFISDIRTGRAHAPAQDVVARHSRQQRCAELAGLLNVVTARQRQSQLELS
ncbi:MAG: glycosyltransferase [Gammaproteobacteria bacterium]